MRIAYLIHHVSRRAAGVLEVVKAQARELAQRGHTVMVFGYDPPNEPPGSGTDWQDLPVRSTGTWLSIPQGYSPRLERWIAEFRPDILHTHGIWTGLSLSSLRARASTGAQLVISPHGMLDPWALRHRSIKKRVAGFLFERRHLAHARLLQALTPAEATDLRALDLPGRIAIVPNGVDLPKPDRAGPAQAGLVRAGLARAPWGPSPRRRVLLFLGRIHEKKGVFDLVDAFERLAPVLSEWRLVIAGFGEPKDEARLRERLRSASASEFIGRQGPDARHLCYACADVFVLPSHSEGLPMTVLEAWSHEKPALISPACHLDIGQSVGAALPILPDAEGLAAGLRALGTLTDEELALRGRAAGVLVRAEYSWSRIGAQLEHEYRELLVEPQ